MYCDITVIFIHTITNNVLFSQGRYIGNQEDIKRRIFNVVVSDVFETVFSFGLFLSLATRMMNIFRHKRSKRTLARLLRLL